MQPRPLTERERAVLDTLLTDDVEGVERLRRQAAEVMVVGRCVCGCPSVDFRRDVAGGMGIRVNAGVQGSHNGLFLYVVDDPPHGEVLGGIEWVGYDEQQPAEFPAPELLTVSPA